MLRKNKEHLQIDYHNRKNNFFIINLIQTLRIFFFLQK